MQYPCDPVVAKQFRVSGSSIPMTQTAMEWLTNCRYHLHVIPLQSEPYSYLVANGFKPSH